LKTEGKFKAVPGVEDIPWDEDYGPITHLEGALSQYESVRRELFITYGFQYVDENGKIDDKVVMSLIASTELSSVRGSSTYKEALEGLSNQYFSTKSPSGPMQCNGQCSITDQILWTSQMEGFYNHPNSVRNNVVTGAFTGYLADANLAAHGFSVGTDDSWFWGNVSRDELSEYSVVAKIPTNAYPGTDFFIVYR
jgi:hypothetical protein